MKGYLVHCIIIYLLFSCNLLGQIPNIENRNKEKIKSAILET